METLTIVLPVHNGANYVHSSLSSVLSQDYPDFTVHVLDSGKDNTEEIVRAFGDPRVRYTRFAAGTGLYEKLNRGFEEATSGLVGLWGHDDIMLPGSLRRFVDFMSAHPEAGMAYSAFIPIDREGRRTDRIRSAEIEKRIPELSVPAVSRLLFWCFGCLPGNISTVMVRRSAWKAVGGFDSRFRLAGDFDFFVRVAETHPVGYLHQPLVEIRYHKQQFSSMGNRDFRSFPEDGWIRERLASGLRPLFSPDELERCWLHWRGRNQLHWVVRTALAGDFAGAAKGLKQLQGSRPLLRQAAVWLLSGNGRFFVLDQCEVFDRKSAERDAGNPGQQLTGEVPL